MQLILASASPRRRALLKQIGAEFSVESSDAEETIEDGMAPEQVVQRLALQKAALVAAHHTEGLILGADTIVVNEGVLLGKPKDAEMAAAMLRSLSGKWHHVMTAIALIDSSDPKNTWTSVETTKVKFRTLNEKEIAAYVATGESMDKAGAYGIQGYGALLIEKIEGCYFNVVGLPLQRVAEGLQHWGICLYEYNHGLQNERISTAYPSARTHGDGRSRTTIRSRVVSHFIGDRQ